MIIVPVLRPWRGSELTARPSQIKTAWYICNDELILSSCSDNPDLRVWDARTGIIATTLKTENAVTSIEISEDGKYITTADGKNVTLWDVGSFRPMETWKMKYNMESASVCMKEGKFVCGGEDMWVHLHDCANGGEIGEPERASRTRTLRSVTLGWQELFERGVKMERLEFGKRQRISELLKYLHIRINYETPNRVIM